VDARRPIRTARTPSRIVLVALLALVLSALTACAGPAATIQPDATASAPPPETSAPGTPSPTEAAAFPLTLTDDEGTEVVLDAEPRRIVSLTPAATETLFALGLGDRVVGKVEDFALYPPEAGAVPDVARFGSVDVESIVALEADLVIAGGDNFNPPEAIARLRTLDIATLVITAPDVAGALADIELIGAATGRSEAADALVADIQAVFDEVGVATADLAAPRVFYELDASSGFFGPAPDSFVAQMIEVAGGDPLTSGTDGVYVIQAEAIVAFDPEVILLGDAAYGVTPEQVAARPGWGGLAAVRSGDVRPIDDVIVTRPGPRLAEGIRALALAIHPDLVLP